ncbi:MAG: hypothetical protein M1837_004793 [Sclerophora amabilis]|nr:MAG: hypothetical protein M1837_004793 [Sclerophora amabilis]
MSNSTISTGTPSNPTDSTSQSTSFTSSSSSQQQQTSLGPSSPSSQSPSQQPSPNQPSTSPGQNPTTSPPASPATTIVNTITPSGNSGTPIPTTVTLTSTSSTPPPTQSPAPASSIASSSSSAAAATSTPLKANASSDSSNGGLTNGGKIAVAVVVPVVAVVLIVLALIFFWRRRKQRKDAEELRRKEVEEYGFNPNKDPTLPAAVGGASSNGDDPYEMREDDTGGYRGWGATTSNSRKLSTTLSGSTPIGMAVSDHGSQQGGGTGASGPSGSPTHPSSAESQSGDPLVSQGPQSDAAELETVGALGSAPTAGSNRQDIHRGPSNASSSYSAANHSDTSGEGPLPGGAHSAQYYSTDGASYYDDGTYHRSNSNRSNSYGDGFYGAGGGGGAGAAGGGGQPVIRDVQARRNTRIENPSVLPQKGNTGISQNF